MDTEKLAKRLSRIQERSSGGNKIWFKSTEDKQNIRMVPYPHEADGSPFIEVYFHYNVAGNRSLVCPLRTHGEPCPICELAEEFKSMGSKDSWKVYKTLEPKLRTYSPIIVRGESDVEVKLWGYGVTIYEALMEKFLDKVWGDLSDITAGRDLTVWSIPANTGGNDSNFIKPRMDVSPERTVLLKSKKEVKKLLSEIPNYLNDGETFPVRSYVELQEIVAKLSDTDDDYLDDSTDDLYLSVDDSKDDDSKDDDDLTTQLDDLLKGVTD